MTELRDLHRRPVQLRHRRDQPRNYACFAEVPRVPANDNDGHSSVCVLSSQLGQHRQAFQIFPQRFRWRSPKRNAFSAQNFLRKNSALPPEQHAFLDAGMLADAYLSSNHNVVFNGDTAGKASLGGYDHVLANKAVVSDVDQIVDLGSAPDARRLSARTAESKLHRRFPSDAHARRRTDGDGERAAHRRTDISELRFRKEISRSFRCIPGRRIHAANLLTGGRRFDSRVALSGPRADHGEMDGGIPDLQRWRAEANPALYLGFDRRLPINNFGIYADIVEQAGASAGPVLVWEYFNGAGWQAAAALVFAQPVEHVLAQAQPGAVRVIQVHQNLPRRRR